MPVPLVDFRAGPSLGFGPSVFHYGSSPLPSEGEVAAWGVIFGVGFLALATWRYGMAPSARWGLLYLFFALAGSFVLLAAFRDK